MKRVQELIDDMAAKLFIKRLDRAMKRLFQERKVPFFKKEYQRIGELEFGFD